MCDGGGCFPGGQRVGEIHFEALQLRDETRVGLRVGDALLEGIQSLLQRALGLCHQICRREGHRAREPSVAVDQHHAAPPPGLLDELAARAEHVEDLLVWRVLDGLDQVADAFLGKVSHTPLGDNQDVRDVVPP